MAREVLTTSARTAAAGEPAVVALALALKNTSFYEPGHQVVRKALGEARSRLVHIFEESPEFVIKFVSGYLVVQDTALLSHSAPVGNLVGACHRRGIESIVFRRGVDVEELQALVEVLTSDPAEVDRQGGAAAALSGRGVECIILEQLQAHPGGEWRWIYTGALDVLRGAAMGVRMGRPLDIASIQSSVREIVNEILGERSIVHNLSSMKGVDEYTFAHALHICVLAIELGRQMNLSRGQLEELGVAGLLHDVGKVFVPLEILRKPASLDAAEFATMSRHPIDGAVALSAEPALPPSAPVVAFEHHVHCDYSGYPKLSRPRELHMYSLMASVTDVYDALTTMRPYRPPIPPRRAIEIIREQYTGRLEPRLVEHFLTMLGPYPWGSLLRLPSGLLAVVTRPNAADPDNPFVRSIVNGSGRPSVSEDEVRLRSLMPRGGEPDFLDPVEEGLDLTALLHRRQRDGAASAA